MRRMKLSEIHDQPGFPAVLRDYVTDALQAIWERGNVYQPIAPILRRALEEAGTTQVVDLCSGGGGPWLRLAREFNGGVDAPLTVCLTDLYPNREAFEQAGAGQERIIYSAEAVDATDVPPGLHGFRTMFSSFHHFDPSEARKLLRDAAENSIGVGVFEAPGRNKRTMLMVFVVPLLALGLTPLIRPFRWSRLFWTYLAPVVPFVLWFDGIVSCLRAYSREELQELVAGIPGIKWEIGEAASGLLPITYLIGASETAALDR